MTVKIHLENAGAIVSAEGDADFVKAVVEQWKHLLDSRAAQNTPKVSPVGDVSGFSTPNKSVPNMTPDQQYENVFAVHNEKLKVISDLPGSSKAEVTRIAAQVILFGEFLRGNESVTAEIIKGVCQDHGAYDPKNFASHLKSLKSKIVMDPKPGGDYTVKLTAPGRKAAKAIVESMQQQGAI